MGETHTCSWVHSVFIFSWCLNISCQIIPFLWDNVKKTWTETNNLELSITMRWHDIVICWFVAGVSGRCLEKPPHRKSWYKCSYSSLHLPQHKIKFAHIILFKMFLQWFFANKKIILSRALKLYDVMDNMMTTSINQCNHMKCGEWKCQYHIESLPVLFIALSNSPCLISCQLLNLCGFLSLKWMKVTGQTITSQ